MVSILYNSSIKKTIAVNPEDRACPVKSESHLTGINLCLLERSGNPAIGATRAQLNAPSYLIGVGPREITGTGPVKLPGQAGRWYRGLPRSSGRWYRGG